MSSHAEILRVDSRIVLGPVDAPESGRVLFDGAPAGRSRATAAGRFVHLVLQAKRCADRCDVVWAANENLGLALTMIGLSKPLVVVVHHLESPLRATLAAWSGAAQRWDGIGYMSDEARQFLIARLRIPPERLFQYESAKFLRRAPNPSDDHSGPIMSVGVAKRDYGTLVEALSALRGCETEIYPTSKFGDALTVALPSRRPDWVRSVGWQGDDEMFRRCQRARFVVVPLQRTTHGGAGVNVVFEASALGKAVIATRTGGMETFVKDGETGILVPPYDVAALRDAIGYLWSNPAVAARMGMAGRRYVEQRFNPRVINRNIIAFVDNLRDRAARV